MGLFSKGKDSDNNGANQNWYADRYQSIAVQRNMLFFLSITALVATVISVIFISKVTLSKTIEPLVVQVEDNTGFTTLVNPRLDERWTTDKSINTYFLVNYLRARETYNISSYAHNYNIVTRLMSSSGVYSQFKSSLNNPSTNPISIYGANNSTNLKIRSVQFLKISPTDNKAQIRFSIVEQGGTRKVQNKIVALDWSYVELNLSFEDRTVNPLGFQVKAYSISDDVG
jgi:type IV secretion system protein VirB8